MAGTGAGTGLVLATRDGAFDLASIDLASEDAVPFGAACVEAGAGAAVATGLEAGVEDVCMREDIRE